MARRRRSMARQHGAELWPTRGVFIRIFKAGEPGMLRWAIIFLVISLIAGGLGLTNVSAFAKKISLILFGLFFLGFLALLGFAYLVAGAVSHSEMLPALVAVSV
jgi:uncharacterized membrane protein YtjA (UPF0391 family)